MNAGNPGPESLLLTLPYAAWSSLEKKWKLWNRQKSEVSEREKEGNGERNNRILGNANFPD